MSRRVGAHGPRYHGPTLLEHLHSIEANGVGDELPFRFPVQWVNRPNGKFRGFSGTVVSGSVAPGDTVLVASSGHSARVKEIFSFDGALAHAAEGNAVTLTLDSEIDIARGDFLADPRDRPECVDQFAAHIIWLSRQPFFRAAPIC